MRRAPAHVVTQFARRRWAGTAAPAAPLLLQGGPGLEAVRRQVAAAFTLRQGGASAVPVEQAQAFCAFYLGLGVVRRPPTQPSPPTHRGYSHPGSAPTQADRRTALHTLSTHFGARHEAVRAAAVAYVAAVDGSDGAAGDRRRLLRALRELAGSTTPVHAALFAAVAQLPTGMEFVLRVRADLQARPGHTHTYTRMHTSLVVVCTT
jgi:hypothetical protein